VAAGRRAPAARAAVVDAPRARRERTRPRLVRILPSVRSLVVSVALVTAGAGAYAAARETSLFAVTRVEVRGAPPPVAQDVRGAVATLDGTSLVVLTRGELAHWLARLPWMASWTYDRAFPHTLRLTVEPERPLAVARRGAEAWLVSAHGKVVAKIGRAENPRLPRIWLAKDAVPAVNRPLAGEAATAVAALAPAAGTPFLRRVRFVRVGEETLTLVLRSGLEVRLGSADDVPLKLDIARRILPSLAPPGYLDLSVPRQPVSHTDPRVVG